MVSRKQHILIIAILGSLAQAAPVNSPGKKFYSDDPLWREPAPRAVRQVAVRKVDDIYDFLDNTFVIPGRERKAVKHGAQPALDVNTLGEVPDSPWYTNRHWLRRMSIAELERGPGNTTPPSPSDAWRIVGAKSDGVTPGFVIEDGRKNRYLLKFDPPRFPELCSAADVIGSKFFYALGYSTPENYVVHFRRENLAISDGVTWRDASGRKHSLTDHAVDELLKAQPKGPDGAYRALASRWIAGQVVGPFSYRGTRTDDSNDTIPHEDRRMLRGMAVFSAWLNHHDTRSINTMDALVVDDGPQHLKHYLLDFGSILGSDGFGPKEPWAGHEYTIAQKEAAVQMLTFGFYTPRWMRSDYPKLTGAGLFDSWSFDPIAWKSNYPNPAFLMMDREDAFWAAKQVAAFTDDEIRAIVKTGEYSDQRAADWIVDCLIKRRDKIAQAWFSRVLPLDRFRIADGRLAFDDLSAGRGLGAARSYDVRWSTYDNDHDRLTALPNASGTKLPPMGSGTDYLAATIACSSADGSACPDPITVYLRRAGTAFEVVGVDR
jgi:hypothetical protein